MKIRRLIVSGLVMLITSFQAIGSVAQDMTPIATYPWASETSHRAISFIADHVQAESYAVYVKDLDSGEIAQVSPYYDFDTMPMLRGYSWSPDGSLITYSDFVPDVNDPTRFSHDIFTLNIHTGHINILTQALNAHVPVWSPDGSQIAYVGISGSIPTDDFKSDLFVMDVDSGDSRAITELGSVQYYVHPSWSPDGAYIAFGSHGGRAQEYDLYVASSDGESIYAVVTHPGWDALPAWSPDGEQLLFSSQAGHTEAEKMLFYILDVPADWNSDLSNLNIRQLGELDGSYPSWSKDGQQILFSRANNIYMVDADGNDLQLIVENAQHPQWVTHPLPYAR